MVGVLHDQAALCLPEDLVQAHGGHQPGADDLAQNIAGADAGQLVGITYHDNAAAVAQRCDQGLKQLHIHHAHFVQNDHIALEQVLVVVDKADHAAGVVHLQRRWMVLALRPVSSLSRLAARPVGAHRATRSA